MNVREGANSMQLTTVTNFTALFKIKIDGKMLFSRDLQVQRGRRGVSGQRVICTTSVFVSRAQGTAWMAAVAVA